MANTISVSDDPRGFQALAFHDITPHFRDGSDTPRAYLERDNAAVWTLRQCHEMVARLSTDMSIACWYRDGA